MQWTAAPRVSTDTYPGHHPQNGVRLSDEGDAAVGKSALCQMSRSDGAHFQRSYSMCLTLFVMANSQEKTAGVELLVKSVNIPDSSDSVELFIFDSAGKETFAEPCEKLWGQPSVLCLVFDLTSEASFRNCSRWLEQVRTRCQGLQVPGVLVGNKSDLSSRREVEKAVAQNWAQSQGLEYHQTSAKETENCEAPFVSLAQAFYNMYQDRIQVIHSLA